MDPISKQMAELANLTDEDLKVASTAWPIRGKFYTHSNKEDNYDAGEQSGLTGDTLADFRYTGSEIEFDIEVSQDGSVVATHVNGVEITKPVKI